MTNIASTKLEQETEQTRERVAALLDELRARVSPGEVVDQVYDYARDGTGADFVRNLKTQVKNNPLACALIGAGIGWLLIAERKGRDSGSLQQSPRNMTEDYGHGAERTWSSARDAGTRAYESTAEQVEAIGSSVSDASARASGSAANVASKAREAASQTAESIGGGAAAARRKAADLAQQSRRSASRMARAGSSLVEQVQNQPLVLAGIGLAIGALLGAGLPATRTEDRLMGSTSDELKKSAKEFGEAQQEKAEEAAADVAERSLDEASEAAEEVGIVPPSPDSETAVERGEYQEPLAGGADRAHDRR